MKTAHLRVRAALATFGLMAIVLATVPGSAQQPSRPASRIASPAEVLGYALGERFTDVAATERYFEALAAASPRVRVRRYGQTLEGRPLLQVVVAREDYLSRLDEVLARNRELTQPGTTEGRAKEIAATNPGVAYFSYGVHGNESSSTEAALWTAWDLASGSPSVAGVLDSLIVVIDPVVNPDGRDRYVTWYRQAQGVTPNPDPESREHWEQWPSGRTNHYLFDLNRDWAWLTQPETHARLATWDYWSPQVHVDFHEMSYNSSYFFFPATAPINPLYPEHILSWGKYIGQANAAAFDQHGWAYYTGESYDLFYPAYGDSWPSLTGAIGMTYEQAGGGSAGVEVRRRDGQILTLAMRAQHHRISGEATLRATAARKSALLGDFAHFHRTVGEGTPDILLVPAGDDARVAALVDLLRSEDREVQRATKAFQTDATAHQGFRARKEFPAGTYVVRARQPRGRLAVTLLQPETVLKASFSYDISAWSLPYAYGVEAHRSSRVPDADWQTVPKPPEPDFTRSVKHEGLEAATISRARDGAANGNATSEPYGYLVRPTVAAWRALVQYLQQQMKPVAVILQHGFTIEGNRWPAGTIFLARGEEQNQRDLVAASGLTPYAVPVRSGFATEGHDLGTDESYRIKLPRIAVLTGEKISASSYGAHWFFLEQTLRLPFNAVPAERVADLHWEDYDVLVVPELAGSTFDDKTLEPVKRWIQRGGTLIAVGGAAKALATPLAEIKAREEKKDEKADLDRALRGREAREQDRWQQEVPGTILATRLDPAHPLAFGAGAGADSTRLYVLKNGNLVFEPDEAYESVAFFPDKLEKVSGVISGKSLEQLSRGTWLATKRVGRGHVVLFADDPLFRAFWYGTFQPYINALMLGPSL
jgi:hypothetical protein